MTGQDEQGGRAMEKGEEKRLLLIDNCLQAQTLLHISINIQNAITKSFYHRNGSDNLQVLKCKYTIYSS